MDIAELLKKAPKGTILYSTIFGNVKLEHISNENLNYPIRAIRIDNDHSCGFTKDGKYVIKNKDAECVLFPSKYQRDWNKFVIPREDLPKGTPCVCFDYSISKISDIMLRRYNSKATCINERENSIVPIPWNNIIPVNKFNFDTLTFDEKDNYGNNYKDELCETELI